ncbi:MAG: FAD-dependent oxidoreductase [Deltaproteobacteria bacterium]|nr:FAD-dependent oxidoreductase [Deltaproteobacteria bacterium]MBT4087786.1 FAD-dependent oxidoreductase [Deltaproteobacteria bacterium]MBT4265879.1 FAD-dependent oxidoreductase [Deltaproteobacteria bacterium]MBT4643699.1 FAD-dependent oxidoreductase [Deltaproteobacteria bacterium]MBT6502836.1 FAD-dependent oxidoreductase [Deltaproteobacteria bacterium]
MNDPVFQPITINKLEIKNRICLPAMHLNMAEDYLVTDQLVDFYAERARGGAGLITVGFATVDELSSGTTNIGAHKDEFIPGLSRLAAAIKDNGARAAVQINHAGKNSHSMMIGGKQAVAPSAVFSRMTRETPRALEIDEIPQVIDSFAQAALRVKKAGFDAVEVLAGTGYLISSFLSLLTNQRTDEWGGSYENRMRFGVEVIKAIRKAVGEEYPILVRMNGNDLMPQGVGRLDLQVFAKNLVAAGVNTININVGWHDAKIPQIVTSVPRGAFGYLSKEMKQQVDVPVITGHRVHDIETARELIGNGVCDMVAMGRSLIADPFMPEKARTGRKQDVLHCIACAQGCFDHLFELEQVRCLCNPKAGREAECLIEKTKTPKKVMVIGGGAAGMSAALAADEKGHAVTLFEKTNELGGQLHLAGAPPGREEFLELAKDLAQQIQLSGVELRLDETVDEGCLDTEKPDYVMLATGAKPITLPIPGVDLPNVVQAWDVLTEKVQCGKKVAIIGGGAVGVEVALYLAEKGTPSGEAIKFLLINGVETPEDLVKIATKGTKEVVLLEMLEKVGKDIGKSTRWVMMQDLSRYGVIVKTQTKASEITSSGVRIEIDGRVEEIEADTVVLASGSKSENAFQSVLERKGIPHQIIGDASQIALAYDAMHSGFDAGSKL